MASVTPSASLEARCSLNIGINAGRTYCSHISNVQVSSELVWGRRHVEIVGYTDRSHTHAQSQSNWGEVYSPCFTHAALKCACLIDFRGASRGKWFKK